MKTVGEIYDIIMPAMAHCSCGRDALEAAKVLQPHFGHLYDVIHNARSLLVAHGGDTSHLTESEAQANGCDMIQWAMLQQIKEVM